MDLDLVFIGTAASVPTANRGLSSALIRRGGERLLFDCGEGTQRQLMRSTGLSELDAIFITHLHADHILGLPGLLKTFSLRERTQPLTIFGPPGLYRFWKDMDRIVGHLSFLVEVFEIESGIAWDQPEYIIEAVPSEHGVPSVAWRLDEDDRPGRFDVEKARSLGVEPGSDFGVLQRGGEVASKDGSLVTADMVLGETRIGRRVVYSGDTAVCDSIEEASHQATLLVHEATFLDSDSARAADTHHSTAAQVARMAKRADVDLLALTHISARYLPHEIRAEAQEIHASTIVARDFDVIDIPYPERGRPSVAERQSSKNG